MSVSSTMDQLFLDSKRLEQQMIEFRRELHRFPELSLQESETAAKVADKLAALGLDIKRGVGGHGIVAELKGAQPGRVIALRADMDALPIQEETNLPFASERPGIMHACGHDAHTSMLLGAAQLLTARKEQLAGTVRFLFQAAEEVNAGAKAMIADGALDGVEEIYGLHNSPTIPAGTAATRYGPLMGSVDRIEIFLEGKGGHGAMPDQSIDPIVAASAIVMGLQTAVSREVSPFAPAVVTIGSIHAGDANNVIPQRAEMTGTIRTFDPNVQRAMPGIIERIVKQIAEGYRCKVKLNYIQQTSVLVNHDQCVAHVENTIDRLIGRDNRLLAEATMAGEDFSIFLNHVPGCFFWLGSGPEQGSENAFGLHHPQFTLNEDCLAVGASLLAGVAATRTSA